MQKKWIAIASALALSLPLASHAQFNLGSVGSALGSLTGQSADKDSSADMGGHQDKLVRTYVAAGKEVLTANGHMASALGIQAQALNASTTSDSFSASDLEAQDKAISANSAAIADALKSGATLKDAESKALYAQGLLSLAKGLKKYSDMRNDAQSFLSGSSGISALNLGKLQSGMYITKNLPGNVSNLSSVLKSAIDFARSNGVEVPQDATSLL